MNVLTSWMSGLKLTIQQWGLFTLACIAGLLAAAVVFYRKELQRTRVQLLSAHFSAVQAQQDAAVAAAADKVSKSKTRMEDAITQYHNS